ncbi:Crossover junction endonuclease mus81 [Coemansia javaensis]|uniref:Crossover junction endonuclease MUS81 n=1 Tax=Coemansia javaensis TaxID=2761396 RepID=A0A9W8HEN4_9FUNG|nr:Crossover junction endonuclease mus81 [Coemansia javaensis]
MAGDSSSSSSGETACANPLFLEWVGEWYAEACARNAQTQHTLKKALDSLRRYPVRLETAQDAMQLQGIGQGIADRLAKRLDAWRRENGIVVAAAPAAARGSRDNSSGEATAATRQAPRIYVPRYRSGAFALLLGLLKTYCLYGPDYYIPKSELVPMCENYTDTPFHVAGSSNRGSSSSSSNRGGGSSSNRGGGAMQHTAWSGMKTLETKSLAERQGGVKFCLTDEGLEIALKVAGVLRARGELSAEDSQLFDGIDRRQDTGPEVGAGPSPQGGLLLPPLPPGASSAEATARALTHKGASASGARPAGLSRGASAGSSFSRQSSAAAGVGLDDLARYPAGEYDIILAVDNREVHSTADRGLIEKELEAHGVRVEVRPLTVGDYLWIARAKPDGACRRLPDVVLDYVVERKRMDDLCASIRDGRYREQHARIHGAGFTNVFYVVEGNDPDAVGRIGEAAVASALSRVQVHHGFHLKRPPTFEATLRLLRQTTAVLGSVLGDVHAIPDRLVGMKGFADLKGALRAKLPHASLAMSFDAYELVSNKSGSLAVGEIYLRMLMTMRGMSADKALTIGARYPTLARLVDALGADADAAKTLADMTIDGTCRRIGPVLGKRIAQFWTADAFGSG